MSVRCLYLLDMQTPTLFRVCLLCDEQYAAGTYRAHAAVHVPKRKGNQGPTPKSYAGVFNLYALGLSQSEIARQLGVTRQRVHQILKGRAA